MFDTKGVDLREQIGGGGGGGGCFREHVSEGWLLQAENEEGCRRKGKGKGKGRGGGKVDLPHRLMQAKMGGWIGEEVWEKMRYASGGIG